MLFKVAVALLVIWLLTRLLDVFNVYPVGDLGHVFLLLGGMLLLLSVLKSREAALGAAKPRRED